MQIALGVMFAFAIMTLWVSGYWPVTVFQVGIFILAGMVIWQRRHNPPGFAYPLVPLSFAVLWGLFQLLTGHTSYVFDTETAALKWTSFLGVFLIGFCVFESPQMERAFRTGMLCFGFLVSAEALLQVFTAHGLVFWIFPCAYPETVMGPILSRNHYAAFIEVVLPLAVYEALRRHRNVVPYSAMAATMYVSVIAAAARMGAILATAEIVIVALLMWGGKRASARAVGLSILQMTVLLAAFMGVVGWQKISQRFPEPLAVRHELNRSSLHMIADHPGWGSGLGTWPTVYPRYAMIDLGLFANQAHNDWLEWTVEGGIPLGLLMFSLFVWCLRPAFGTIWGLGVIAVFLHAVVDYPFSRPALGAWPILLIGMFAARQARGRITGAQGIITEVDS